VDACYDVAQNPTLDPNNPFCQLIHRSSGGSLNGGLDTGVDQSDRNIGFLRSEGVDLTASYSLGVGNFGSLAFGLNLTRQLATELQFTPTSGTIDCVGLVGKVCLRPTPELKWLQTTTWSYGPVAVQLRWRHLGKLTQDAIELNGAPASNYMVPVIDSFDYFDLSGSYDLTDSIVLHGGVQNLFDKGPPVVGNDYGGTAENSGNTFPQTYDVLGRSFLVSATARF
jgi:outer membrane receptor protein involved in Fe transport